MGNLLVGLILFIVVAAVAEAYFRRNHRSPFSKSRPKVDTVRRTMGTEEIDHVGFNRMVRDNEARAKLTGANGKSLSSWTKTETAKHRPEKD